LDGFICRFQTGNSNGRTDYKADVPVRGDSNVSGSAMNDFHTIDVILLEPCLQNIGIFFFGDGNDSRFPALGLFEGLIDIAAGGECHYLKPFGVGFDHAKSAPADGAGRT
jgi:hypothetical protein